MSHTDAQDRLAARVEDLLGRAQRGEVTHTAFLTPAEQKRLSRTLGGEGKTFLAFGGYKDAERQRLFLLPPYMQELDEPTLYAWLQECFAEQLVALRVCGSGYRELSHRDYLGAILNLGIERDAVGDLCVTDTHTAVLFCDSVMADFLCEHLERVANDAVRTERIQLPEGFDGGRSFRPVSDTVASPRADSVVAALANLSRERAQALFREGAVEIDYEAADKPDRPLHEGAVIVIRGKGKFVIRSLSQQTKKGRIRLVADQYI